MNFEANKTKVKVSGNKNDKIIFLRIKSMISRDSRISQWPPRSTFSP